MYKYIYTVRIYLIFGNIPFFFKGRYIDITAEGEVKEQSVELLRRLKSEKLGGCLDTDQLIKHEVKWTPEGVSPEDGEHAAYLATLREVFINKMKDMVIASLSQQRSKDHEVYNEALHHAHFCKRKGEDFQGREQLIQDLQMAFQKVYETEDPEIGGEGKVIKESSASLAKDEDSDIGSDVDGMQEDSEISVLERQELVREQYSAMKEPLKQWGVSFSMEEYSDLSDPNKDIKTESLRTEKGPVHTKPLVVYGESGCGKTALLAKLAEVIKKEMPESAVVVRFLGTSPQSSSIRDTLVSICHQIDKIFNLEPPRFDLQDNFPFLVQYFLALLWRINSASKPLYILLDSLDQLHPSDHAFSLNWLPTQLPENVHVVLSTLPEMHGLMETLKNHLMEDKLFFEVSPLPMADASDLLLKVWSRAVGRQFTQQQRQVLKDKVSSGAAPLYLKLLFYQAVKWHSYTDVADVDLGLTAQAAINKLFDDLEVLHGKTLISHAFGELVQLYRVRILSC